MGRVLAVLILLLSLSGCARDSVADPQQQPSATATGVDEELRDELLTMAEQDQAERRGEAVLADEPRTARLREIIDEHGWPTYDLVGEEAADAAWLIAQHSDLDPGFQAEALELLREAVAEDQASPGNLAYLEDRVAVADGEPQRYGTQVGCGPKGPKPSTPIQDPDRLGERRADAGLPTYGRYLRTMTRLCRE
jgi:hypothetical protein